MDGVKENGGGICVVKEFLLFRFCIGEDRKSWKYSFLWYSEMMCPIHMVNKTLGYVSF